LQFVTVHNNKDSLQFVETHRIKGKFT